MRHLDPDGHAEVGRHVGEDRGEDGQSRFPARLKGLEEKNCAASSTNYDSEQRAFGVNTTICLQRSVTIQPKTG